MTDNQPHASTELSDDKNEINLVEKSVHDCIEWLKMQPVSIKVHPEPAKIMNESAAIKNERESSLVRWTSAKTQMYNSRCLDGAATWKHELLMQFFKLYDSTMIHSTPPFVCRILLAMQKSARTFLSAHWIVITSSVWKAFSRCGLLCMAMLFSLLSSVAFLIE